MSSLVSGYVVGADGVERPVASRHVQDDYHLHFQTGGWHAGDSSAAPVRKKRRRKSSSRRKLVRLLVLQEFTCFYCGEPASPQDSNVDHVVPQAVGGSRKLNNLVASHTTCNTKKADKMPTLEQLERLAVLHRDFR